MDELNKQRALIWIKQAKFDLEAANLSFNNGFNEWCAFQCEQTLEKALKAVMVFHGLRPPKIHKIPVLIHIINQKCPTFKSVILDFKLIESYTFISRYPFLIPKTTECPHEYIKAEYAKECILDAQKSLNQIFNFIQNDCRG